MLCFTTYHLLFAGLMRLEFRDEQALWLSLQVNFSLKSSNICIWTKTQFSDKNDTEVQDTGSYDCIGENHIAWLYCKLNTPCKQKYYLVMRVTFDKHKNYS